MAVFGDASGDNLTTNHHLKLNGRPLAKYGRGRLPEASTAPFLAPDACGLADVVQHDTAGVI